MSKEKRKARWLFFGKDKYTYDTIDELVNKSMGLAVGEVVTLNGYYSADDGATHKRVIADTDDGSGVELRSGKWANIINISEKRYLGKRICMLGDSITALPEADFFKKEIKNQLGFSELNSIAVSGATIINGNSRPSIQTQVQSAPLSDIYTIFGGVNDYVSNSKIGDNNSNNSTTIKGAVKSIIKALQTKNPKAEILFITPLPQFWDNKSGENSNDLGYCLLDYSKAIIEVCNIMSIPVLNLTSYSGININNQNLYLKDGIHPNSDGYKLILPKVIEYIKNPISDFSSNVFTIPNEIDKFTHIAERKIDSGNNKAVISLSYNSTTNTTGLFLGDKSQDVKNNLIGFIDESGLNGILKCSSNILYFNDKKISTENIDEDNKIYSIGSLKIQMGTIFIKNTPTTIPIKNIGKVLYANVVPVGTSFGDITIHQATESSFICSCTKDNTPCYYIHISL